MKRISFQIALRARLGLIGLLALLAAGPATTSALAQGWPASAPADCRTADFGKLQPAISQLGATPAAAATMTLPDDGAAKLNFKQPIGTDTAPVTYRVFEQDDLNAATRAGRVVTVLSVEPATATSDGYFKPTDSVTLATDIPAGPPWRSRTFVVVACKGAQVSARGQVRAPVSNRSVSIAICVLVGLLAYVLAMTAVFVQRRKPHALEVKYPAVFGARKLYLSDFWNPIHLVADNFHRGSVQKAQVLLFTVLVGELVLSMTLRTGALVDLSSTVVALLGISGVGAAAAQIAYQQKTRLSFENWAWLEQRHVLQPPAAALAGGPYWRDLVMSNREFDVYKLQTIIFTVAVASALIVGGATHLSSFSVPQSLLGILGLSQVVYVGGVLVKPPAVADLDEAITKLRQAKATLETAKARGTDTDANGKLLDTLPAGGTAAQNAQHQYDDLADTVVAMIESALEVPADRGKL